MSGAARGVPPRLLFVAGALLFPPFLLQQDIVIRGGLVLCFLVLNVLSGRRVRVAQSILVAAGIVVFNLVIPAGRVLAEPFGLPITETALKSGLMKATAMTGLIFLSQFSVRSSLRLPGRFGGLVGTCLFYFQAIMNERGRLDRRDIIGSLDSVLLSAMPPHAAAPAEIGPGDGTPRRSTAGVVVLGALVAVNWLLFLATVRFPTPFWGNG